MSITVSYPVEVQAYRVSAMRDRVEVELSGTEELSKGSSSAQSEARRVGRITFATNPRGDKDFINRGGFLQMDRPLEMFAGILDLLRNERPLFLLGNGTISTTAEPAGEEERVAGAP